MQRSFSFRLHSESGSQGINYEALKADPNLDIELTNFENQTIRTVVIKNWPDDNFLYQVFLRLNTGSVPLSPQELRHALHPGQFAYFVDKFSTESVEIRQLLNITEPDFRMRDAEIVIRYFAFRNFLREYTGNLSPLLDYTTKIFNSTWSSRQSLIAQEAYDLTEAIQTTLAIFGRNACRKWNGKSYERPFNRAIFDVMVLHFDNDLVRRATLGKEKIIESQFKSICENNVEFRASIEGTTKSTEAIYNRIKIWGAALNRVLNISIEEPSYDNKGRIVLSR